MLSEGERRALELLRDRSVAVDNVDSKSGRDFFGNIIPGMGVFKKLDRKGFCIICEPIVDDDGFEWTPYIDITSEGIEALKQG